MHKIRQAIIKHLWWVIAISGAGLLACHSFQIATVTVDTTTLALLALILLSPFVAAIKRIKLGEFEAEIDPEEGSSALELLTTSTIEVLSREPLRIYNKTDKDVSPINAVVEIIRARGAQRKIKKDSEED